MSQNSEILDASSQSDSHLEAIKLSMIKRRPRIEHGDPAHIPCHDFERRKPGPELMQVISLPRFLLIIAFITIYYYQYVQNSALVVGIAC